MSSKQDTAILRIRAAKKSLHQRDVALHFRFSRELMAKKPKKINDGA